MLGRATSLLAVLGWLLGAGPALAWLPAPEDRFDAQLVTPFNFVRPVDVLALDLFETSADRIEELRGRGVRAVCLINAGTWENWRPDARTFPAAAIGQPVAGWVGERWLDTRALPALQPILRERIALCREKGFSGVLFDHVDGHAHRTGFPLSAGDQLAFARWLAAEGRKAKLAVGFTNSLDLVPELVEAFDFAVAESCFSEGRCAALVPFQEAGKTAYAIEYTNQRRKMERFCAEAAELGLQLIFKTKSLNGKLHGRCP